VTDARIFGGTFSELEPGGGGRPDGGARTQVTRGGPSTSLSRVLVKREGTRNRKCSTAMDIRAFRAPLQDLRNLVDTTVGPFSGSECQSCSTNRTSLRSCHMMYKETEEKTKQLPSERFCKEQKLRPATMSHRIIL